MNTVVIIGGGVAGLAFANYTLQADNLNRKKSNIIIIEKADDVGGCHKVDRFLYENEYYFSEHSPRIYMGNYINFINLLKTMNLNFTNIFTKYKYSLFDIIYYITINNSFLSFNDVLLYTRDLFFTILSNNYGKNISLKDYLYYNQYSQKAIDFIDIQTRSTDGGDISRISLNQHMQILIENMLYNIYLPKLPNDINLFKKWKEYLILNGVKILTSTTVKSFIKNKNKNKIEKIILNDDSQINGDIFILAMPPESFTNILKEQKDEEIKNAFGNINKLTNYSKLTEYNEYISVTLHWDKYINLTNDLYGLNAYSTEWNLIVMDLSTYMKFTESKSKSVLSIAITFTDVNDKLFNKTANQCNEKELILSVMNQLRNIYKDLSFPSVYIINNYYDEKTKIWKSKQNAFIKVPNIDYIDFKSTNFNNLYNLGTHNGKHKNSFTSVESAISNSIKLAKIIHGSNHFKIKRSFDLRDLFIVLLCIFIFILAIIKFTQYGY